MIDLTKVYEVHALHDAGGWHYGSGLSVSNYISAAQEGGFNSIKSWSWVPGGSGRLWDDWNADPSSTLTYFRNAMDQYIDAGLGLILDVGDSRGIISKYVTIDESEGLYGWNNFHGDSWAVGKVCDYYEDLLYTYVDEDLFLFYSPFAEPTKMNISWLRPHFAQCVTAVKDEINSRFGTTVLVCSDIGWLDNKTGWKICNETSDITSMHQYFCTGYNLQSQWATFKSWSDELNKPILAGEWGFQSSCVPSGSDAATKINRMLKALTQNDVGSAFWTFFATGSKVPTSQVVYDAFSSHGFGPYITDTPDQLDVDGYRLVYADAPSWPVYLLGVVKPHFNFQTGGVNEKCYEEGYDVRPESGWTYEAISDAGFNTVTIYVNADRWTDDNRFDGTRYRMFIDSAIKWCSYYDLYCIISLRAWKYPSELPFEPTSQTNMTEYGQWWRDIAEHYAGEHPHLLFKLGEEPVGAESVWKSWCQHAINRIREVDSARILIATGSPHGNLSLYNGSPLTDTVGRTTYSFGVDWYTYGTSEFQADTSYSNIKNKLNDSTGDFTEIFDMKNSEESVGNIRVGFKQAVGQQNQSFNTNLDQLMQDEGFTGWTVYAWCGFTVGDPAILVGGDSQSGWTTLNSKGLWWQAKIWSQPDEPPPLKFEYDAWLLQRGTQTVDSDAYLKYKQTQIFDYDSIVLKTQMKHFSSDAWLMPPNTMDFDYDAILLQVQTRSFMVDAYLHTSKRLFDPNIFDLKIFDVAVIKTKTFTFDAVLEEYEDYYDFIVFTEVPETVVQRDPARFGQSEFGYTRFGVYTTKYQEIINRLGRNVTRRLANWNVDRNTSTGQRVPSYDDQTIQGILVESAGTLPAFASGVVFRQDAVLITLDGVDIMDQIMEDEPTKYWEVVGVEEHTDPNVGGLAYRVCQLHRLVLYKE